MECSQQNALTISLLVSWIFTVFPIFQSVSVRIQTFRFVCKHYWLRLFSVCLFVFLGHTFKCVKFVRFASQVLGERKTLFKIWLSNVAMIAETLDIENNKHYSISILHDSLNYISHNRQADTLSISLTIFLKKVAYRVHTQHTWKYICQ